MYKDDPDKPPEQRRQVAEELAEFSSPKLKFTIQFLSSVQRVHSLSVQPARALLNHEEAAMASLRKSLDFNLESPPLFWV